jgi:hypothetical protein
MGKASRRHVGPLMKPWRTLLLVAAVCVFAGSVTVFLGQRRDMIAQIGNSFHALHLYPALRDGSTSEQIQETKDNQNTVPTSIPHASRPSQDMREEDHKFLDDLVQKGNQDGNPLSAPVQNTRKAGAVDSSRKLVPRAGLVMSSEIVVRRAELVVPSGTVKRTQAIRSSR